MVTCHHKRLFDSAEGKVNPIVRKQRDTIKAIYNCLRGMGPKRNVNELAGTRNICATEGEHIRTLFIESRKDTRQWPQKLYASSVLQKVIPLILWYASFT